MRKVLVLSFLVVSVVGAVGCSDGDDSTSSTTSTTTSAADSAADSSTTSTVEGSQSTVPPEDLVDVTAEDYVEAWSIGLTSGSVEGGNLVLSPTAGPCVAEAWVTLIGRDRIVAAGVSPEQLEDPTVGFEWIDLDAQEAADAVDAFETCEVDIIAELVGSITIGLDEAQRACVAVEIDPDLAKTVLLAAFSDEVGDPEEAFNAFVSDLTEACDLPT